MGWWGMAKIAEFPKKISTPKRDWPDFQTNISVFKKKAHISPQKSTPKRGWPDPKILASQMARPADWDRPISKKKKHPGMGLGKSQNSPKGLIVDLGIRLCLGSPRWKIFDKASTNVWATRILAYPGHAW